MHEVQHGGGRGRVQSKSGGLSRKRKPRRGKGGRSDKTKGGLVILLSNIRGVKSKKESLLEVLKDVNPDICILNETGLRGKNKLKIQGYITFSRNRVEKAMGGISTSVKDNIANCAVNVGQGAGDDEFIIVRLEQFTPAICLINYYGEQEGRVGKEEVNAKWERMLKEIRKIRARGEECLLIGDFNKLVGCDELGIQGNKDKISHGGQLLRELLATEEYLLVNNMDITSGGPFTRVDPADKDNESALDFFICSRNLRPYIKKLVIDSKRKHAMKRVVFKNGSFRTVFADHYTLIMYLKDLPGKALKREKMVRWNLRKEGGWEKYKVLAEDASKKVSALAEDKHKSVEEITERFYKISDDLKFKAFGKITIKDKCVDREKVKELFGGDEAKEFLRRQQEKAEEELMKLKSKSTGRVSSVFQIVRSIQGPSKGGGEAHAVEDPESNELAVTASEIKRVSLDYCKKVLKNNPVCKGFEREIELKERLHEERMLDLSEVGFTPNKSLFDKVVLKFKKNNKRNYDFIIHTGVKFKEAVFKLCKRMLEDVVFPASFDNTTLHQIYKGKGPKEVLSNSRYIHSKEWLPRLNEGMVVEFMKDIILKKSSPYQIGGQPGHRAQEHIFSIKSILAKNIMEGEMVILQEYDLSKFFDKEAVPDVMNTLHEAGVDGKAYRAWAKLNGNTNIRVKTGVGYSEWSQEGPMIGQGTGGGALVSQLNIDQGVVDMFHGSDQEISYGAVRVLPVIFMDDISRAVCSLESARAGNVKMSSVVNSKQLTLNQDKTCIILFGNKDKVCKAREELARSPLYCGDFITKEKTADKWLGDIFHQGGLAESVVATIKDRTPKIKAACYEAAAIVEDWRSQCVGGFCSAIDLFELAILPSLLYNADTWVEIPKVAEEMLENLQLFFIRLVLRLPQGTPKIALRSETGLLAMKYRVWKAKCMLILHLKGLEDTSLAKMVYIEQIKNNWPGLVQEVRTICQNLDIEDASTTSMSKFCYRKVVDNACRIQDEVDMKGGMVGMTKMEKLMNDDCARKEYMGIKSLKDVRDTFRMRTQLIEGIKGNQKNKYRGGDMTCQGCKEQVDTQSHVLTCGSYEDLRYNKDLSRDEDLVLFFKHVVKRRMKED